ncbi:uncharacterized protein BDZ83DRAFT_625612, partial [Colletotrichum acutatum]
MVVVRAVVGVVAVVDVVAVDVQAIVRHIAAVDGIIISCLRQRDFLLLLGRGRDHLGPQLLVSVGEVAVFSAIGAAALEEVAAGGPFIPWSAVGLLSLEGLLVLAIVVVFHCEWHEWCARGEQERKTGQATG